MKKRKKAAKTKKTELVGKTRVDLSDVEKTIKSIIAEVLEVSEKKITANAKFVEDLGMDSMRALEILAAIERTYKIEIPEGDLVKMVNYNEAIKLTKKILSKHAK